jgi:hypothetical protein
MATYYVSALATGGGDGSIGNPWTLAEMPAGVTDRDKVLIKADGEYTISSGLTINVTHLALEGYGTTPGDRVAATITVGSGLTGISTNGTRWSLKSLAFDGGGVATTAWSSKNYNSNQHHIDRCDFSNFASNPVAFRGGVIYRTRFADNAAGLASYDGGSLSVHYCTFDGCVGVQIGEGHFGQQIGSTVSGCIFCRCTGSDPVIMARIDQAYAMITGNRFHGSSFSGYFVRLSGHFSGNNGTAAVVVAENIFSGTSTDAVKGYSDSNQSHVIERNAYYNVGAQVGGWAVQTDGITLSADPYVDAAGDDFNLTDTARDAISGWDFAMPGLVNTVLRARLAWAQNAGSGSGSGSSPTIVPPFRRVT